MTKSEIVAAATKIGGFYGEDELESLYDCLIGTPAGSAVVETGVFRGRSTSVILSVTKKMDFYTHLIDPFVHDGSDAFPAFSQLVTERFMDVPFTLHKRGSYESWVLTTLPSIGFIHIDGNHDYPGPETEVKMWFPKLIRGGYMVFHDYYRPKPDGSPDFPSVTNTVDALINKGDVTRIRLVDSQIVVRKV